MSHPNRQSPLIWCHKEKGTEDMIKLKTLRLTGHPGWSRYNLSGSFKRDERGIKVREGDVVMKPEMRVMWPQA